MSRKLLDPPVLYLGSELNIGLGVSFGAGAGMGYGALLGVADGLRVFPQRPRLMVVPPGRPRAAALGPLGVAECRVDSAGNGIDRDRVTIPQERDRPADRGLRTDMADAEAVRGAREASVGDQRDLFADTLDDQCARRRPHLAHA